MQFFRLIKPDWARQELRNGDANPNFKQNVPGPSTIEGCGFSPEYLAEKNRLGYNVYFFPNHPDTDVYKEGGVRHLNGRTITNFNVVFVDMDLKDKIYATKEIFLEKLRKFPVKPSLVVDSGNGVHAYWKIEDLKRESYVAIQLKLIQHLQTDTSVWTTLQLMRLPGLNNTKKFESSVKCQVLPAESSYKTYTTKQLSHFKGCAPLPEDLRQKAALHINRLDGKLNIDFNRDGIITDTLPDRFLQLLLENRRLRNLFDNESNNAPQGNHAIVADMALCHLLYTEKFTFSEALSIMLNTQTAIDKKTRRVIYATATVEKVFYNRKEFQIESVSTFLKTKESRILEPLVMGPGYLDYLVLGDPWRRKELLGIISGSGVGKTSFALNIIHDTILKNDNDDVFVFFTIEMTKGQVAKRWLQRVGENSPLGERLFVIDSIDSDGSHRTIGLQEMYEMCLELKQQTGKRIGMVVMDHFHIISTHIDIRKTPNFSIHSEQGTGHGNIRNLSLNSFAKGLKILVDLLDTYGLVLCQTTKAKGIGDLPIAKDGCYGCSQFEWIMARIITIWQPLLRVQDQHPLRVLAFQYCKLREKHPDDKIFEYDAKLLRYQPRSGALEGVTEPDYKSFLEWLPVADEARRNALKKEQTTYTVAPTK